MVNKVILIGNLGKDPEIRSTPSGQPVATLSLATERKWRDKAGQKQKETEWHTVVIWGKQAEIAGQYLTKGKTIYVEGHIKTRTWDDRNSGEKKYKTEIVCENFQMLGGGGSGGGSGGGGQRRQQDAGGYDDGYQGYSGEPEEDDIPFGWIVLPFVGALLHLAFHAAAVLT